MQCSLLLELLLKLLLNLLVVNLNLRLRIYLLLRLYHILRPLKVQALLHKHRKYLLAVRQVRLEKVHPRRNVLVDLVAQRGPPGVAGLSRPKRVLRLGCLPQTRRHALRKQNPDNLRLHLRVVLIRDRLSPVLALQLRGPPRLLHGLRVLLGVVIKRVVQV